MRFWAARRFLKPLGIYRQWSSNPIDKTPIGDQAPRFCKFRKMLDNSSQFNISIQKTYSEFLSVVKLDPVMLKNIADRIPVLVRSDIDFLITSASFNLKTHTYVLWVFMENVSTTILFQ